MPILPASRQPWHCWSLLATVHLSPWPHLVGFPALGALAALFGRYSSQRDRHRIVLICGLLLVAPA
ncbi:hypothetical protein LKR43_05200 [Pusillimonas sp. MFBS29]|uniref:hypothetical protein n=1 Tax=Pusillimonas sp. MFBS29 TaxID=2886690 RepID=UPI001D0FE531|nr:hypothetical protein [Pusillimonas sp. MFBS29]MCC2595730.1 hypothetical protein [Pusillimonas sp. MFBS29]